MNKINNNLSREEYKYFISPVHYSYFLNDLKKFTVFDGSTINDDGFYHVASIYFENNSLNSYFDKLNGIAKRVKLRLRYYPLSKVKDYKIELKYKFFDKIVKKRTNIKKALLSSIFEKNSTIKDLEQKDEVLLKFLNFKKINNFFPFIRIDYNRIALIGRVDKNVRITIDQNIKCCRFTGDLSKISNISVFSPGASILEIKTSGYFPFWLTYLVKKYSFKKNAISKYVHSVQKLAVNSSLNII